MPFRSKQKTSFLHLYYFSIIINRLSRWKSIDG
jgi:hypothetical protein